MTDKSVNKQLRIVDVSHLFGRQVEGIAWRKRGYLPEAARYLMAALAPEAPIPASVDAEASLRG
ncbi:MAG: hypothetical protein O7A06_14595 [Acidobacteria bacterium]|nr:hypothetical protein [Acidobacteriota bacterium]MCZ6752922.1 hypothetical protein [Acidobacteriota bacterium]